MIILTEMVGVSWRQTLQINDVSSFVSATDAFNFNTAGNLDDLVV